MSTRPAIANGGPSTIQEFLAWGDEDLWAEWVNGKVVPMAAVTYRHQEVVGFLFSLLNVYVQEHDLGVVSTAPFAMYLASRQQVREPDVVFVSRERAGLIKDLYLEGPADVVVEVVSPDSRTRDRVEKVADYEAAGVREYWLIDPRRRQIEFRRLDENGRYRLIEPEGGIFVSEVIEGFRLQVDWLWREPPPKVLDAARELGLV